MTISMQIDTRGRGIARQSLLLTALAVALACAAICTADASAAASRAALIASPRSNQSVSNTIHVRPRVGARKGPYVVRLWVDGKLYNTGRARTRRIAQARIPIDTRELGNGSHRLKVEVDAKTSPRRARESIRINVANSGAAAPSGAGQPAPSHNLKNYRLLFAENFDKPAAAGSMVDDDSPDSPVYEGSSGVKWLSYPTDYYDTFLHHPYRPDKVLSVHDNVLDFWLHNVDGKTSGASVSPLIDGTQQYQTYGRYSVRMRLGNAPVSQYNAAFLLWPQDNDNYEYSESDFPEMQLNPGLQQVTGYAHYGKSTPNSIPQEYIFTKPIDLRDWHTYTQEWSPGQRRFYLDNKLVYTTRGPVWAGPERWQLQIQSYRNGTQSGHLYIDWASVWAWSPGTPAN